MLYSPLDDLVLIGQDESDAKLYIIFVGPESDFCLVINSLTEWCCSDSNDEDANPKVVDNVTAVINVAGSLQIVLSTAGALVVKPV